MAIHGRDDSGQFRAIRTDDRGSVKTIPEVRPADKYAIYNVGGSYTQQITNATTRLELPEPNGLYLICASGQTAYCAVGGTGTTVTTAVGGFDFPVFDGTYLPEPVRLAGSHFCHIGTLATTGFVTLVHLRKV